MRKLLIATTALTMLAGAASADVTLVGLGYFGLQYNSKPSAGKQKTQLLDRLQIDIKASKKTDSGLTFFGKFRIRSNQYQTKLPDGSTSINAGQVGVSAGGLSVAVGNVSDAIDAMNTYYDSELGLCACGGETLSVPIETYDKYLGGHNGVLAIYTMGDLVARASWQTNGNAIGTAGEGALSFDYKVGAFKIAAGYVHSDSNGAGGYAGSTVVIEYALGNSMLGLAAGNNSGSYTGGSDFFYGSPTQPALNKTIVTLYGSTKFGATTVEGFVSQAGGLDTIAKELTKTTYGVSASYDLGSGAAVVGSIQTTRKKNTYVDLGASFSF